MFVEGVDGPLELRCSVLGIRAAKVNITDHWPVDNQMKTDREKSTRTLKHYLLLIHISTLLDLEPPF